MFKFDNFKPLLIGIGVALLMYTLRGWWGFLLIFGWIGASITIGLMIATTKKRAKKDIGRKIGIIPTFPVFVVFLGILQRENLQLEETVFYTALFINFKCFC